MFLAFVLPGIEPNGNSGIITLAFAVDNFPHQTHERGLARSPVTEDSDSDGAIGIKRGTGKNSGSMLEFKMVSSLAFENGLVAQECEVVFIVCCHI